MKNNLVNQPQALTPNDYVKVEVYSKVLEERDKLNEVTFSLSTKVTNLEKKNMEYYNAYVAMEKRKEEYKRQTYELINEVD